MKMRTLNIPFIFMTFLTISTFILLISTGMTSSGTTSDRITIGDTGYYLKVYNAINSYRSKHVSPSVRWNRTFNDAAEALALQLAGGLSQPDPEDMEGVNYFGSQGGRPSSSLVVSKWYNESSLYDYINPGYNYKYLNFTQLVWKSSTMVGIGAATFNNFSVVVTMFVPPGNIRGRFRQNVIPPRIPSNASLTL